MMPIGSKNYLQGKSMKKINISSKQHSPLKDFLEEHDYIVKEIKPDIWEVSRDQLEVFLKKESNTLFFEIDLGDVASLDSKEFYRELLELNTKILPVSLGVAKSQGNQDRLILIESRETDNFDDNEILSVFEALEIACHKVESLLNRFIKNK